MFDPGPPPEFWNEMVTQGASHAKHDGSEQSALKIIGLVVERSPVYLHIQKELHAETGISQTGAAQVIIGGLKRSLREFREKLDHVQGKLVKANEQNAELLGKLARADELNIKLMGKLAKANEQDAHPLVGLSRSELTILGEPQTLREEILMAIIQCQEQSRPTKKRSWKIPYWG